MGEQSGGNPRFKSAGTQWKSSWKGRVPFTEMCCIDGFNQSGITGNWYQDLGGVLPLVPASGFFISAVVGIGSLPLPGGSGTAVIASNGNVAGEGWELVAFDGALTPAGDPTVGFAFRVYDGVGITAVVLQGGAGVYAIENNSGGGIEPQLGVDQLLFRIFAWFEAPGAFTDGAINIAVEGTSQGPMVALAAPYVNTDPRFFMGVGQGLNPFLAPNCIQGLVGGDGIPSGTTVADMDSVIAGDVPTDFPGWIHEVGLGFTQLGDNQFDDAAENQIVAPTGGTFVPTLSPTNGWRANNPALSVGLAPDPLAPFLGAVSLTPAFPLVFPRDTLTVACAQPSVFWAQTIA